MTPIGGPGDDHFLAAPAMTSCNAHILFGDILFGAPGNDAIEGGRGKDVLLLDGILKDYTIEATKQAGL